MKKLGSRLTAILTTVILMTGCGEAAPGLNVVEGPEAIVQVEMPAALSGQASHMTTESLHTRTTVSMAAVGDIMVHRPQLLKAYDSGEFDFSPSFTYIKDTIASYDYAMANLETTLAGAYGQRKLRTEKFVQGYSGYPVFNAPDILAENLQDAGFDMLLTANNHTLDSKVSGLERTIDVIDALGLDQTGSFKTEETQQEDFLLELNGMTFGVLDYTYAMNGFTLSKEEDYKINHLNNYDSAYIEKMYERTKTMAEKDVDFVIVALHYGIEYVPYPDSRYQLPLIDGLFENGADIIFGGHPHVLQPFDVKEITRPSGETETGVVIYSLGNFLSSQRYAYTNKDTDYGMIFEVNFSKLDDRKPVIDSVGYTPTYVVWGDDPYIVPLLEVPEEVTLTGQDQSRINYGREAVLGRVNAYYEGSIVQEGAKMMTYLNQDTENIVQ